MRRRDYDNENFVINTLLPRWACRKAHYALRALNIELARSKSWGVFLATLCFACGLESLAKQSWMDKLTLPGLSMFVTWCTWT